MFWWVLHICSHVLFVIYAAAAEVPSTVFGMSMLQPRVAVHQRVLGIDTSQAQHHHNNCCHDVEIACVEFSVLGCLHVVYSRHAVWCQPLITATLDF